MMEGWKYYNHALVPTTAPHEKPPFFSSRLFKAKMDGMVLFARWVENFDCGYETNWWYLIKDTPLDISKLNSKRRYEINKGRRYFDVIEFKLDDYREEVADIYIASYDSYSAKSKPYFDREAFIHSKERQDPAIKYFGAFAKEDGKLCAFCFLKYDNRYADYISHKAIPDYEKLAVNAALVAGMLDLNKEFLSTGGYICDGARSIRHETHFQDYLAKYFEFRKAYCDLHVEYRPLVKLFVKTAYPFRCLIYKMDYGYLFHSISALMKQEEILRDNKK